MGQEFTQYNPKTKCLDELIKLMPQINGEGLIDDGSLVTFYCIFEEIYFKKPACDCPSANRLRKALGAMLLPLPEGIPIEDVVVVPVPDSGKAAARGYAEQHDYTYDSGFTKWADRSFIKPPKEREGVADWKYEANHDVLKDKIVVIIDDSVVRGTTIKRLIIKAFEAKAKKVYFKSSAPPILFPCYAGIEMKKKTDFIAKARLPDGISYEDIDLKQMLEGIHKEVFEQCRDLIEELHSKGTYKNSQYSYMLSKINNEQVSIEYQTIENLLKVCNSFYSNNKVNRWCISCLNGFLHILKGTATYAFEGE